MGVLLWLAWSSCLPDHYLQNNKDYKLEPLHPELFFGCVEGGGGLI
jgi:hypothetical protein